MNNLTSIEPERELPTQLDIAKQALADATENWQRVQIRDTVRAVEAAAAILKRKDIQIQAANLVQEAERAIAKASPPQQGKRTDRKNFVIHNHEVSPDVPYITPQDVRQMRYAHNNLTDAEFEAAQQEAIETQTPLTRSALQKRAKAKKQADNRSKRDTLLTVQAKPLPIGETKYHIIYADPPWRYNFTASENRAIENQYPTMELDAIKALPVPRITAVDAVLYLWATAPKLKEAIAVMEAWGFAYKTNAVWVKDNIGMGYWWRNQHELLLVGTHGNFPPPEPTLRVSSVFKAPKNRHSEKPQIVAEAIEKMFPARTKIELFSREPRKGWAVWGNEITDKEIQHD